jgi:hypothetical protein
MTRSRHHPPLADLDDMAFAEHLAQSYHGWCYGLQVMAKETLRGGQCHHCEEPAVKEILSTYRNGVTHTLRLCKTHAKKDGRR